MNSIQINKILKKDSYSKTQFLGTFAFNQLPIINKYPSCLVFNNQSSDEPGEHWLAIYFNKNKTSEFFDSFGHPPEFYGIKKYLKINSKRINYNKKIFQGFDSYYCGLYVIFYILFKTRGRSLNNYKKYFGKPHQNDKRFQKMLNYY
jgi:hypothetical protein